MKRLRLIMLLLICCSQGVAAQTAPPEATITPEATPTIDITMVSVQPTDLVDAFIEADNEAPQLGEPFTLTITIDVAPGTLVTAWPALPQDDPTIEVIDASEFEETNSGNRVQYTQNLSVRLWQTGAYMTPEIPILYETSSGAGGAAPVRSVSITVPSLLDTSAERDLRPAAPPIDLPYTTPALYVVAGVLLIIVIWLLFRLLGGTVRRTRQLTQATPSQRAIARLSDLNEQNLPAIAALPILADTLRIYLVERFHIPATEQTTVELLQSLTDVLPVQRRQQLAQILNQADLTKFAQHQPDSILLQKIIAFAIRWVRSVDDMAPSEQPAESSLSDE